MSGDGPATAPTPPPPDPEPPLTWRGWMARYPQLVVTVLALLAGLGLLFGGGLLVMWWRPEATDPQKFREWLVGFGPWSVAVFIVLQAGQVILAPIPGQVTGLAGGYLFGWVWGLVYTMTGLGLGTLFVLVLARWLGRPFVLQYATEEAIADLEALLFRRSRPPAQETGAAAPGAEGSARPVSAVAAWQQHGLLTFFLIMLLPAFPDDLVCLVAGLSGIPIWQLFVAAMLGRFPGMFVLNAVGAGLSESQGTWLLVGMVGGCLILTGVYLWQRERIESAVRGLLPNK